MFNLRHLKGPKYKGKMFMKLGKKKKKRNKYLAWLEKKENQ